MCSDGTLLNPSIMLTFCSVLKGDNWTECKYQETHLALLLWICMVSNAWMDVVFHISLKLLNRLTPKKKTCFDEFGYCSCRNWSEKKNMPVMRETCILIKWQWLFLEKQNNDCVRYSHLPNSHETRRQLRQGWFCFSLSLKVFYVVWLQSR